MLASRILKGTGIAVAVTLVGAIAFGVHTWSFRPVSIDLFFERVLLQLALKEPQLLSETGLLRQFGYRGREDELSDVSPAHLQEVAAFVRESLETLRSYDRASLSPSQQLSYDVLEWYLEDQANAERWMYHDYPFNQMLGVQSDTPDFMVQIHVIEDPEDARNYNKRLAAFREKFDGALEGLKLRESKGSVPPRFVIDRVATQMREFIGRPAKENVLYTNLRDKLAKAKDVSREDTAELLAGAEQAIDQHVYPAYSDAIAFFDHLAQTVTDNGGVWKLPDGDAYYDHTIRSHTTTSLKADEIHELGLAEVARIEQDIDAILEKEGTTQGSRAQRLAALRADPRYLFPNDDEGRKQCLAEFQRVIDEMIDGLGVAFRTPPKLNIRIERVPVFMEATTSAAYAQRGSLDGSRPSVFYLNLRDMKEIPKFGVRTLAYHESVPGHQLQGAYADALAEVPTFRRLVPFTAYGEGWGLYAERLAWEMGYEKDPMDDLGRLQAEMLRATRLVVDTGIHRKRWTREQAIDYMVEKTGQARSDITSEVERYFVMPGQALSYKVGMIRILQLRERAKEKLGSRFDLRDFHDVVLTEGELPLSVLEKQVDAWIARRSAEPAP
jgi:uncharacterized protein (DUF885 family)